MRGLRVVAAIALGGLSALIPTEGANSQESKSSTAKTSATALSIPVYKPPLLGAPGGRVGGGTRGTGRAFVLSVLAPDHSGLTLREQPSLYWYISDSTTLPVELTIIDPRATRPVLEVRLPSPVAAGIHGIRLGDHGVRLAPGVTYQWSITVVPDAARRSRDILTGGAIERIEAPEPLRTKLATTRPEAIPHLFAEAGLWYDALAAVSELIDSMPSDPVFRQQRAALISQVGLSAVVARER